MGNSLPECTRYHLHDFMPWVPCIGTIANHCFHRACRWDYAVVTSQAKIIMQPFRQLINPGCHRLTQDEYSISHIFHLMRLFSINDHKGKNVHTSTSWTLWMTIPYNDDLRATQLGKKYFLWDDKVNQTKRHKVPKSLTAPSNQRSSKSTIVKKKENRRKITCNEQMDCFINQEILFVSILLYITGLVLYLHIWTSSTLICDWTIINLKKMHWQNSH